MKQLFFAVAFILFGRDAIAIELNLPVVCDESDRCSIHHYVDQTPGAGADDFLCRSLSFNQSRDTAFRVPVLAPTYNMQVLAAADGVVKGVRIGQEDRHIRHPKKGNVEGVQCGNGILLEHKDGWETQYCHLKNGSVKVKQGEAVKARQVIASVGLSGDTDFPHMAFSVFNNAGTPYDPFNAQPMEHGCGEEGAANSLWNAEAQTLINTDIQHFQTAGISSTPVNIVDVMEGAFSQSTLRVGDSGIVFWALLSHLKPQDEVTLILFDPEANIIVETTDIVRKSQPHFLQYIGKKRTGKGAWKAGLYQGVVTAKRGSDILVDHTLSFDVK